MRNNIRSEFGKGGRGWMEEVNDDSADDFEVEEWVLDQCRRMVVGWRSDLACLYRTAL